MLLSMEQEFAVVIGSGLLNFKSKSPEIHFKKKFKNNFPENCNYSYTVTKADSKKRLRLDLSLLLLGRR